MGTTACAVPMVPGNAGQLKGALPQNGAGPSLDLVKEIGAWLFMALLPLSKTVRPLSAAMRLQAPHALPNPDGYNQWD